MCGTCEKQKGFIIDSQTKLGFREKPLCFSDKERRVIKIYNSLVPHTNKIRTIYKLFDGSILAIQDNLYVLETINQEVFIESLEERIEKLLGG